MFTSSCRATIDADAPGASDVETISRLRASAHDLGRRLTLELVSIIAFVDTSNPTRLTRAGTLRRIRQQAARAGGPHRRALPIRCELRADLDIDEATVAAPDDGVCRRWAGRRHEIAAKAGQLREIELERARLCSAVPAIGNEVVEDCNLRHCECDRRIGFVGRTCATFTVTVVPLINAISWLRSNW